jgi:hypothetical protein
VGRSSIAAPDGVYPLNPDLVAASPTEGYFPCEQQRRGGVGRGARGLVAACSPFKGYFPCCEHLGQGRGRQGWEISNVVVFTQNVQPDPGSNMHQRLAFT